MVKWARHVIQWARPVVRQKSTQHRKWSALSTGSSFILAKERCFSLVFLRDVCWRIRTDAQCFIPGLKGAMLRIKTSKNRRTLWQSSCYPPEAVNSLEPCFLTREKLCGGRDNWEANLALARLKCGNICSSGIPTKRRGIVKLFLDLECTF